jgi:streptogramin lyase
MFSRSAIVAGLSLLLASAIAGVASAGQIHAGDLIVTDFGSGTLLDVNPITGASFVIASGFSNPQGVAINAQGKIFVSDIGTSTIDDVNPTSGVVTTFSGNGVGTGPALNRPFQMEFFAGTLYVAEGGGVPIGHTTAVYTIDANGNRTSVAGNNGSSNNLFAQFLAGLALDSTGTPFASAPTAPAIYRVGAGTATPLNTTILAPQGLAFNTNGQLLAVSGSPSNPSIWSVDPTSGNATVFSDNNGAGSGPAFNVLRGITVGNGLIYATDVGNAEIYTVNPATGDRSVLSGNGVGGSTFSGLSYGIAVYPNV